MRRKSLVLISLVGAIVASCSSRDLVRQNSHSIVRLPETQWLHEAAEPSDSVFGLAARDLQEYHNGLRSSPEPLSDVEEAVCYEGQLRTESMRGTLHVFSYCSLQPTPHTLIIANADSLGTLYDSSSAHSGAISRSLVDRLASMLAANPATERQALESALFIVNAQDILSYRTLRVLKDWRGITHSRMYPVPDSIKRIIKGPTVEMDGANMQIKLFVWQLTSTALTQVTVIFTGGEVQSRILELGRYGHPSAIL